MPKILFYWLTMGEYHYARMNALSKYYPELHIVELTNLDDHHWVLNPEKKFNLKRIHLGKILSNKLVTESIDSVIEQIETINPDVVINGSGFFDLKTSIQLWILKKKLGFKLILWSESTELDNPQTFIKSIAKKQLLKLYDNYFVAGIRHFSYVEAFGVEKSKIFKVGNVVDNNNFKHELCFNDRNGFLFVGRFLAIKNIPFLIDAYNLYKSSNSYRLKPWKLTIVGNGPEFSNILKKINSLGLNNDVHLTGNLQPSQVKLHYERNAVFILPSISEPWGLVINEAMASGMPILVSERCGSIDDLLEEGVNGYSFSPHNIKVLAHYMCELAQDDKKREVMGRNSLKIVSAFTPENYAISCHDAINSIL